jgi:biopolymer transport protein ExbB
LEIHHGNPENFEGGNIETGTPLNTLGQVYHGGAVVPVLLGMLLMVLVFSIEIFVISKAAGKTNLDAFMTKIQASIKQGEIEEAIATCDKQQGSVMQLNQR